MSQKTIKGSHKLGEAIKNRRQELNLTIEEAASRAGVGTKSWCRYESGESIRSDKVRGILKALNWPTFPGENDMDENAFDIDYYRKHEAWSPYICKQFGECAALSFVIGSELLFDCINQDLEELSTLPKGSHIGQLSISMLKDSLPKQFLMRYDYEFLYQLRATVLQLTQIEAQKERFAAHTVMEELIIYMFMKEASAFMECVSLDLDSIGIDCSEDIDEWTFDIFGDDDVEYCLYSNTYLTKDNIYHFDHWSEEQFYIEN